MTRDRDTAENATPEPDEKNTTGSADGDVTADTASGGSPED
jgi:hypothetical protein